MKDEEIIKIWNIMNDQFTLPVAGERPAEFHMRKSSETLQNKIRKRLGNGLILKAVSGLAFLLNIAFYYQIPAILIICLAGIILMASMTAIEARILKQFTKISNLAQPVRDTLSKLMIFLKRKSTLMEITEASNQILVFVPGLLLYFYIVYGQVKPLTSLSFFVFSTLCLIGTVTAYLRIRAQLMFHIRHMNTCLSDLNENTLAFVSETIEKQRNQDYQMKTLVGLLLIFAFVIILALLKSILS